LSPTDEERMVADGSYEAELMAAAREPAAGSGDR
jgi:hypothetical protein